MKKEEEGQGGRHDGKREKRKEEGRGLGRSEIALSSHLLRFKDEPDCSLCLCVRV